MKVLKKITKSLLNAGSFILLSVRIFSTASNRLIFVNFAYGIQKNCKIEYRSTL